MASSSTIEQSERPAFSAPRLSHLQRLEAESIHIFREVASEFQKPVMLYSIGKDSSVMLRLAQKAFFPGPIPFPLLHVDTGYKFHEMIEFRDNLARSLGLDLKVWRNEQALADGANPVRLRSAAAAYSKQPPSSMAYAHITSTRRLAEPDATKKSPAPRSVSFPSATAPANGTPRISAPRSGTFTTAASHRAKASVSSRSLTGPNSTSGTTFCSKRFPSCRSISPKTGA
jgi:Phosphoadenosine phosphosulfate reductase family